VKILLLTPQPFFQNRGTPIAVKLLVEVLAKNGHNIHILTYHEGEDITLPDVRIHRIQNLPGVKNIPPGPSWKKIICDIFLFFKCFQIIRQFKFDLIHAVEESAFISVVVKYFFDIPFVYDMDSSFAQQIIEKYPNLRPIKKHLEFLEKILIQKSIGVVAVCKYLEDIALRHDPQKPIIRLEDISLLPEKSQQAENLTEKLQISSNIIMYVGNLEKYQGIDLLLKSFRNVLLKVSNANLVIIGGSATDIRSYKLKALKLGIEHNTHFIGPRPITQLGSFLEQADVLASPRIEGGNTPMKIYSYLDSGRPVIATRLPTHTQVLDDQIALLSQPDPEEIAEGMVRLLTDKKLAAKLAGLAKKRVKEEFSYEAFERKLLSFYEGLETKLDTQHYAYNGGI
jgi:glycosyltransferase involved in cell wall biosynthesis